MAISEARKEGRMQLETAFNEYIISTEPSLTSFAGIKKGSVILEAYLGPTFVIESSAARY